MPIFEFSVVGDSRNKMWFFDILHEEKPLAYFSTDKLNRNFRFLIFSSSMYMNFVSYVSIPACTVQYTRVVFLDMHFAVKHFHTEIKSSIPNDEGMISLESKKGFHVSFDRHRIVYSRMMSAFIFYLSQSWDWNS